MSKEKEIEEVKELDKILGAKKKEKKQDIITQEDMKEFFEDEIFKDDEYLREKSCEIINLNAKASLTLGRIFTEVADKYLNNKTGTYELWIDKMGYNKRTALRHRARYMLYTKTINQESKSLIAGLSVRDLEKIMKNPDEFIPFLDDGISKEDLENLLESETMKNATNKKINFELGNYEESIKMQFRNFIDIAEKVEEKIAVLDEKEKEELDRYLKKIEKILNK